MNPKTILEWLEVWCALASVFAAGWTCSSIFHQKDTEP